ncbi:MAG: hypothetical protein ACYC3X_03235 [Pirellulaceae bacterium]
MSRGFRSNLPQSRPTRRMSVVRSTRSHRSFAHRKRARGSERARSPFLPPEDWHEPRGDEARPTYTIHVQDPGAGYRHVVTADEVRERLSAFPAKLLEPLEVVQLSRMTRKKQTLPCYGMQWGSSLYLYPVEELLIEHFSRAPLAAERREAEMYGGRWEESDRGRWRLVWTPDTIRDFYLNNILIHELGHLIDDRNCSYTDRERFADWFAIQYGYKSPHRPATRGLGRRPTVRRHGAIA